MRTRRLAALVVPLLLASQAFGSQAHPSRPDPETGKFRLALEITGGSRGGTFFSAWTDNQDVITDKDASDQQTVTYHRRYIWLEGCTWDASETLTPIDATHYTYQYRENPVSCPDGARAAVEAVTPRDGKVTVHPTADSRPLTPLVAWTPGWDKPRG
ncbi:MAG TPA: hypothetical protein VH165_28665 [Kofleriaceae bacterium]|jgi:hypothetical protein|nr:hypothetical protein [Kofleriaceae bacterium]